MLEPPSMTPQQIADHPSAAPGVRVTCYAHGCTLFVGDELPDGGAEAVAEAAGCPAWLPPAEGQIAGDPTRYRDCPVPGEVERLAADVVLPPPPVPDPSTAPPITVDPFTEPVPATITERPGPPPTAFARLVTAQMATHDIPVPPTVAVEAAAPEPPPRDR